MITTTDGIVDALGNNSSRLVIDKASISNAVAGQFYSLWRATGLPGQGAIPTTAIECDYTFTGAMNFAQQTSPATSYGAWANAVCSNSAVTIEIHDRLAHMGGLSGTSVASQTVNLDLNALTGKNLNVRKGDANFSDIVWWMEWYSDTGSTASNATVNVTYNDGSSGNLTAFAVGSTAIRAGRLISLNGYIPSASAGLFIRDINSVTLSSTTGTVGNFGFTATRPRMTMPLNIANKFEVFDWAALGFPEIANESCLAIIELCSTTTTGTVRGGGKVAHG